MKAKLKISISLILIFSACAGMIYAQRGGGVMRGDSVFRERMRRDMPGMGMRMHVPDSAIMKGMKQMPHPGIYYRQGFVPPRWNMWQPGPGMRRGMGPGMGMRRPAMRQPGMQMFPSPGMRMTDNIPNLTDRQKKEIAAIRNKQMDDMEKFRSEIKDKMKTLRDENRTKIMNLLNDEQKKWFDENSPPVKK